MEPDDVVAPGDAALQALLSALAERADTNARRDRIVDFILTAPPLSQWPTESLARLEEACRSAGRSAKGRG